MTDHDEGTIHYSNIKWVSTHLNAPAYQLFVQLDIKEISKSCILCSLRGESTGDRWIPSQRASDAESVSMSWHHHEFGALLLHHGQMIPLQWRHNEHHGVLAHQSRDCLLNSLFRRRSKKPLKLCVTVRGIHWWPVNSPQKGSVMRKRFPCDDVIMHVCIR